MNNEQIELFERIKRCEWEIGMLNQTLKFGKVTINGIVFTADELRDTFADKVAKIEAEMQRLNKELEQTKTN